MIKLNGVQAFSPGGSPAAGPMMRPIKGARQSPAPRVKTGGREFRGRCQDNGGRRAGNFTLSL